MIYRGPDSHGITSGEGYALGHRRLSIIDLSANGAQPMANEDGLVEVVFNGAIYNFADLRADLQKCGHVFRSRTDTEVLVHGYEQWGIDRLVNRIRGMYAIGIVDRRNHLLHLVRDPLGKKPLFFCFANDEIIFASSIRALLKALPDMPSADPQAIDQLLSNLYIRGPRTIFRGISKLEPGHGFTVDGSGYCREFCHWRPNFLGAKENLSADDWLEAIENTLRIAVKRRLVADVPIGVLLSGGIDSSLVAAFASKEVTGLHTFSVATEDPALDERRYSGAVAKALGTIHKELEVRNDLRKSLTRIAAAMGEPLADASVANVFAIAEKAREHVTVVLTGDGGDEAFGGYTHFLGYYLAERLRRGVPTAFHPLMHSAGKLLWHGNASAHRVGTLFRLSSSPVESTLFAINSAICPNIRAFLYAPEFDRQLTQPFNQPFLDALPPLNGSGWDVDRVMQVHAVTTLPDDYLAKVDVGTMAVSLEARSPFLDLDVMELAARIPAPTRFRRFKAKSLLRSLALHHIPAECVNRRKQGFSASIRLWFKRDWNDLVQEFILGPHVESRGWFQRKALQQLVDETAAGNDHSNLLWGLLILELWWRIAVDKTLSAADIL
jgi:asparagine synthase (glutamine-hydrolysing)